MRLTTPNGGTLFAYARYSEQPQTVFVWLGARCFSLARYLFNVAVGLLIVAALAGLVLAYDALLQAAR